MAIAVLDINQCYYSGLFTKLKVYSHITGTSTAPMVDAFFSFFYSVFVNFYDHTWGIIGEGSKFYYV
jgi:hypothetical protein